MSKKPVNFEEWLKSRDEYEQFEKAVQNHDEETIDYFREMYSEYISNLNADPKDRYRDHEEM